MMRHTRAPQEGCGSSRVTCRRRGAADWVRFGVLALLLVPLFASPDAHAQDPSTLAPGVEKSSSFPKQSMVGPSRNIDKSQPLYLQGDELIYDTGGNKVVAKGNVEIYYNNYILTADQVVYDQSANTLTAVGNATLKEPNGNIVRSDRMSLTDDFRDGFVSQLSIVAADDTRIAAETATRRGGNTTVFKNGRFTPCKTTDGMPPLWCLSAATVTHDQAAATISYQDAQFELFGVPILYTPYFEHADPSVKRKSGFLMPQPSTSDTLGYSTTIPYYFALAPNYDFTFYPMYTSRQGILWQGDWRHRTENGQYYIKAQGIDQDSANLPSAIANRDQYDGWRGSLETKGLFNLGSWWRFGWDVTLESDDTFRRFYKLDNMLLTDRVNKVFLEGISDRNYFGMELYHFGGLMFTDTPKSEVARASDHRLQLRVRRPDPRRRADVEHQRAELLQRAGSDADRAVRRRQRADEPRRHRAELAPPLCRSARHHLHAVRAAARRPLPAERLYRSAIADDGYLRHLVRPRPGAGRCHPRLSVGDEHQRRLARDRADRPDHCPAGDRAAGQSAERGRTEPRVRRHQPVRGDEVLRLRPHRDRHARQRRPAVHLPIQRRRLRTRPRR